MERSPGRTRGFDRLKVMRARVRAARLPRDDEGARSMKMVCTCPFACRRTLAELN
jgi:hypothetical protein